MGFLSRIFGQQQPTVTVREAAATEVRIDAEADGDNLVEVEIVGEGHRQDVIERIAGPKEAEGKQMPVGVTFRCEPTNEYDANTIRVEVYGQQVGFVAADIAARLSPPIRDRTGGVLEGRGLVVGGWRDSTSEGSFGVRGWITTAQAERLGLAGAVLHHQRVYESEDRQAYPTVAAPGPNEERITPEHPSVHAIPTEVGVTGEEHYQDAIVPSRPDGWTGNNWPVVADLGFAPNPHAKSDAPVVEVRVGEAVVGYFTAKMTERHRPTIEAALDQGRRPTAVASVRRPTGKANALFELHVGMRFPEGTSVEVEPWALVNEHTGTRHTIGADLPDGWRTQCGEVIAKSHVRVLGKTRPGSLIVDVDTGRAASSYVACGRCH